MDMCPACAYPPERAANALSSHLSFPGGSAHEGQTGQSHNLAEWASGCSPHAHTVLQQGQRLTDVSAQALAGQHTA